MREQEFIKVIENTLSDPSLLGDDCAFLKDFGLFITQDTLCEKVHFDLNFTDLKTLAKKSVAVNLSDLCANLAEPKYISVSFSAPETFDIKDFKEFYKGIEQSCKKFGVKVSGGDITGSKSGLTISICAIGKPYNKRVKVARNKAKKNQIVCVTKDYGSSAYALYCLKNGIKCSKKVLKSHLDPEIDIEISKLLSTYEGEIAVMDSSDGLCDALFKIAKASNVLIEANFSKIPYAKEIENYKNYKDLILWGGEDYGLVFCVEPEIYKKLRSKNKNIVSIGVVKAPEKDCYVKIDDVKIDEKMFNKKSYDHFEVKK